LSFSRILRLIINILRIWRQKNGKTVMYAPNADMRTIAQATVSIPANVRAANTPIRLRQARCFTK
jgi:hypothetical protein